MKKVIVLFKNENNLDLILKSYLHLKNNFGFEILPIYIKDVAYKTRISDTMVTSSEAFKILSELDDNFIEKVKLKLVQYKIEHELLILNGVSINEIKDYLKSADLLMLEQGMFLSDLLIDFLEISFRPLIILRENVINFNNLAIVSNDGVKVNNSVYNFLNLFSKLDYKTFPVLTWNFKSSNHHLLELLKNKGYNSLVMSFSSKFDSIEDFYLAANKHDLIIMGNLSRSFFFEKVTNRTGLNLLENLKTPIFIG
ncbi:MAG: hypothetical protein ACRC6A_04050 [Fusobacteriaceae bacterium]